MAAVARPTLHGITVNLVYTPPEQRGRGFASNCVAALSQRMLDGGYQFCTLFTNLANPTSNDIYQQIGYRSIADFNEYRFENRESTPTTLALRLPILMWLICLGALLLGMVLTLVLGKLYV